MTENQDTTPRRRGKGRGRAIQFVVVFCLCVLALLTGYRFVLESKANDFYLLAVAGHAAWALDKVGDSAYLEHYGVPRFAPAQTRADIAAWERGDEKPTDEEVAAQSDEPLTPWENWRHRALRARRNGSDREIGPHVVFFMEPGLRTEKLELYYQLGEIGRDESLGPLERAEQRRATQQQIEEITRQLNENAGLPAEQRSNEGKMFDFNLVSECGAIEVMAIFLAAVIAFPTRWWKRFVGVIVGVPLMYGVNIFRLVCLGVVGALDTSEGHQYFDFAHHYLWQTVYIIFVVAAWLLWVELLVKRSKH